MIVSRIVVLLVLCPALALAAAPRLHVLGVAAGEGISEKAAATLEQLALAAFAKTGEFDVTGRSDVAGLLGFEQQKALAGCDMDDACVAEIAGGLGVRYVASVSAGRLGKNTVVLSLSIIDVTAARVVARSSTRLETEDDLPAGLERLVPEVTAQVVRADGRAGWTAPQWSPWVAAGVALVAGGVAAFYGAQVLDPAVSYDDSRPAATAATVGLSVAGVASVTGIGLWFFTE